ncbi:MAG: hypothetical protein HZC28_18590 [Spirochaetes bacterium]|nr:hypothetical protein [Spirochaetota bacterium]
MQDNAARWYENNHIVIPIIVSLFAVSIAVCVWMIFNRAVTLDNIYHYAEVSKLYENGKFFATGTSMSGMGARVPGGMYYYIMLGIFAISKSLFALRLFSCICAFAFAALFIETVYKKAGAPIALFLSLILLGNPFFLNIASEVWNANYALLPNLLLILLFIRCGEGTSSSVVSFLLLPVLTIAGQIHFSNVFVAGPLTILWCLYYRKNIRWLPFFLGAVTACILYLPYLAAELQNGFHNTRLMLGVSKLGKTSFSLPQIYCWFIFPTNEMSYLISQKAGDIIRFYMKDNPVGILHLVLNVIVLLGSAAANIITVIAAVPSLRARFLQNYVLPKFLQLLLFLGYMTAAVILVVFSVLKLPPAEWHYFYFIFALTFAPLLIAFSVAHTYLKRWVTPLYAFYVANFIALIALNLIFTAVRYVPSNMKNSIAMVRAISEDAHDKSFFIVTADYVQFPEAGYGAFNTPPLYRGIAEFFAHVPWNERYDGKNELTYIVEANIFPAYTESFRGTYTNRAALMYQCGTTKAYRVEGPLHIAKSSKK